MKAVSINQINNIRQRFSRLYGDDTAEKLEERFYYMIGRYGIGTKPLPEPYQWDSSDTIMITYGDIIQKEDESTLLTLNRFANKHLNGIIKTIHILPFSPWSSDDGFSVIDYRKIDEKLGDWKDIQKLGEKFRLMFDLVLNHCSSQSEWFQDYNMGIAPARHYFIEVDPEEDLSEVVRPRTSPLLTEAMTREGKTHVWTTFSADQIDLNWEDPNLFFEFIDILMYYISNGARIIRLDAIAFLWKKIGTSCLHLEETHEVVKLLRDIIDIIAPDVLIITETNVPHDENIQYFANGDEAHMVYNFSLPPLLLHALTSGNSTYLTKWAEELSMPPEGCTYFNFTASHDGIGVRPVQGLLPEEELNKLLKTVKDKGGKVSEKTNPDGTKSPYEMNITYYDALSVPQDNELSIQRFLCSQALALAFKGVPAVYFHSLTGTPNYHEGVKETKQARTINRRKWDEEELNAILEDENHTQAVIFKKYRQMLKKRASHPAFHPDARQLIHNESKELFILTRTAQDDNETIFCIFNMTDSVQTIINPQNTKLLKNVKGFYDILSGKTLSSGKKGISIQPYQALWLVPK